MTGAVRVLYIGGSGRSGSTLLDRMIGQLPGFFSAGELRVISGAGMGQNRLCGCGQPFADCPHWKTVGRAFGGWDRVDRSALNRAGADSYVGSIRRVASGAKLDAAGEQVQLLRGLYGAIADAADGATIIDSSKGPRYAALLASVPGIDLRAIHLVRDSRGVAHSWAKRVKRDDVPDRDLEMLRLSAPQVAVRWIAHNVMMELLGTRVPMYRLRYETLLATPREALERSLQALDFQPGPADLDFITDSVAHLRANHTVMGNPMRLAVGDVPLKLDDAWRSQMPALARLTTTALTWPYLIRYGYRP